MPLTARKAALQMLQRFENGQEISNLSKKLLNQLPSKEKPHFTALTKGFLRWKNRIDGIIDEFSPNGVRKINIEVLNCIRIALYEFLRLSNIPDYASINEAVNLTKSKKSKAFVNWILREMQRNKHKIPLLPAVKNTEDVIEKSLSFPKWMATLFLNSFGKGKTLQYCESLNEEEPVTLRVNTHKTTPEEFEEILNKSEIKYTASRFIKNSFLLEERISLKDFEPLKNGKCYIQNASSQIVSHLLKSEKETSILDCCAGPGGKATHMAELCSSLVKLYVSDISQSKIDIIKDNFINLALSHPVYLAHDASIPYPPEFIGKNSMDIILADLPCSALGTIRKNPEIKWTKTYKDIERLASLQIKILSNIKSYVKPQGILLYSVCTFTEEETSNVVKIFLDKNPDISVQPIKSDEIKNIFSNLEKFITQEGFLKIMPVYRDLEPFFIARFKKK